MDDPTPAPPEPAVAPASPFAAVRVRAWLAWLALAGVAALALVLAVNMTRRSSLIALFLPLVLVSFHGTSLLWMRATFARLGISWRRLMGPLPSPAQLGEAVLLTAVQFFFALAVILVLVGLRARFAPHEAARMIDHSSRPFAPENSSPWLTWAGLVVFAPVVEELLFRGLLLHRFAATLGPRRALLVSALLFAVPHAENVAGAFAFALVLGVFYLRTGSLWACMLAHALNNAVPALLITLPGAGAAAPPPDPALMAARVPQAATGAALGALALAMWLGLHWPAPDARLPYERAGGPAPAR